MISCFNEIMSFYYCFMVILYANTIESAGITAAINPEQTAFVSKVDPQQTEPYKCDCYNVTENLNIEIECRCFGKELMQIPTDLYENLTKITITDSDIKYIKKQSLQKYRHNLKDVILGNLPFLRVIEEGSFANISNLRTIYISHAPQLKFLHGLLVGVTSTKFYSLRIVQTGLHEVPNLAHLPPENVMHLLDLDLNKIDKLPGNSVKITAEQVTLNYNEITIVEDLAFNGSQIGKLNLRGNQRLAKMELNAFKGLQSLRELDLSMTSIVNLPVVGLEELEILRIEDTPTMKVIPSIYDLENLKIARLTYSFHCCAFKYPEQHNPQRHAEYEEKIKRACKDGTFAIDTGQFQTKQRRKRSHHYDPTQYLLCESVAVAPIMVRISAILPLH